MTERGHTLPGHLGYSIVVIIYNCQIQYEACRYKFNLLFSLLSAITVGVGAVTLEFLLLLLLLDKLKSDLSPNLIDEPEEKTNNNMCFFW